MQILVTAGVQPARPADEVKADLFAHNVRDAMQVVDEHPSASRGPTCRAGGAANARKSPSAPPPQGAKVTVA